MFARILPLKNTAALKAQPRLELKPDSVYSLPQLRLDSNREAFLRYFENSWQLTETLFSGLANDEAFYIRPYHKLRHPMIFYYGHPVALYINKLRVAGLLDKPLHTAFERLFETGVDEMRWDDLHEGKDDIWPSVDEVRSYRSKAYRLIHDLIANHPLLEPEHFPLSQDSPAWALAMAFEHERIHLETSSVLMREMPPEYLRKPESWPGSITSGNIQDNPFIAVEPCQVALGKPQDYPTFGWDNEYGAQQRAVEAFHASSRLISNKEFHEFVRGGGYAEPRYWSQQGWKWRSFRNTKWPSFWVPDGPAGSHLYKLRTVFEVIPMEWGWPVCVNFHEAKAYCSWRSEQEGMPVRLLTEAEHNALRAEEVECNLGLRYGSETPVDSMPANSKGFHDVFGNVWQWCEDTFHPLPGSKPHPYYDDFSTPCYDGEHQMILGGSFISTGDEASRFARFHFRPHFFQHAGFRIVKGQAAQVKVNAPQGNDVYASQEMLDKYLLMHWGDEKDIWNPEIGKNVQHPAAVQLPVTCAQLVRRYAKTTIRALDLGCAVGRSTFEMARYFSEVIGIDYSHEFIEAANQLRLNGKLAYSRKDTGILHTRLIAQVDESIDRQRIRFQQGDACKLPESLGAFDAVLLANVLCRLPDPHAALARMQSLVKPGGILVMTTPFSWLPEFTPPALWLEDVSAIAKHLPGFELLHREELPFLIREHSRKFEYIITLATVWRKAD